MNLPEWLAGSRFLLTETPRHAPAGVPQLPKHRRTSRLNIVFLNSGARGPVVVRSSKHPGKTSDRRQPGVAGELIQRWLDEDRRAEETWQCGQAAAMLMVSPSGKEKDLISHQ